jgi:epoxyqueuosine reductase
MSELKLRPPEGTNIRQEESLLQPRLEWLAVMSEEEFREKFRGSAMKRTKWSGLVRNACIALGNSKARPGTAQHARILDLLQRLSESQEISIAESARWAISRIQ